MPRITDGNPPPINTRKLALTTIHTGIHIGMHARARIRQSFNSQSTGWLTPPGAVHLRLRRNQLQIIALALAAIRPSRAVGSGTGIITTHGMHNQRRLTTSPLRGSRAHPHNNVVAKALKEFGNPAIKPRVGVQALNSPIPAQKCTCAGTSGRRRKATRRGLILTDSRKSLSSPGACTEKL